MCGTLIGHSESPAAGTSGFSLRVATVGNRASAGDHDHAQPSTESRFQSDLHVAHGFDFRWQDFRNHPPHGIGNRLIAYAGNSQTSTLHLTRIDACRFAPLPNGFVQRLSGASFAHAVDVAGSGRDLSQHGDIVADDTCRFAAAAIDAEEVCHGSVLPQQVYKPSLAQLEDCLHN
jgi:hypothetical protein